MIIPENDVPTGKPYILFIAISWLHFQSIYALQRMLKNVPRAPPSSEWESGRAARAAPRVEPSELSTLSCIEQPGDSDN